MTVIRRTTVEIDVMKLDKSKLRFQDLYYLASATSHLLELVGIRNKKVWQLIHI